MSECLSKYVTPVSARTALQEPATGTVTFDVPAHEGSREFTHLCWINLTSSCFHVQWPSTGAGLFFTGLPGRTFELLELSAQVSRKGTGFLSSEQVQAMVGDGDEEEEEEDG